MIEQEFTVENRLGLHARPAALFVRAASKFRCQVKVTKNVDGDKIEVNGKSVMGILMLAVAYGERVSVVLDGPDEQEALRAFGDLFAEKFSEE
ncbi:MAG: HPr family phosphocarrier protein [Elusimicrobiota bacterium]